MKARPTQKENCASNLPFALAKILVVFLYFSKKKTEKSATVRHAENVLQVLEQPSTGSRRAGRHSICFIKQHFYGPSLMSSTLGCYATSSSIFGQRTVWQVSYPRTLWLNGSSQDSGLKRPLFQPHGSHFWFCLFFI